MTQKSRLAKLEKRISPLRAAEEIINFELVKFNAYIGQDAQMRADMMTKLDAVLAGDENLQAYPDTPARAFLLERLDRIAEAHQ